MDKLTEIALRTQQPALTQIAELLEAAEALVPLNATGREQLERARLGVKLLVSLAQLQAGDANPVTTPRTVGDVLADQVAQEALRGDDLARRLDEQKHLGTKSRMLAQKAEEQFVELAKLGFHLPDHQREQFGQRLGIARLAIAGVDRVHRTGVCGCPPDQCQYAVKEKPAPLRRHVGPFVKQPLRLVRDEQKPDGAA
jgi:hypothetical protein